MSHGLFELFTRPETKGRDLQDMKMVVNKARCPQNHPCPAMRVCPVGALSQKNYEAPVVDEEKCIKCGKCARYCAMGAMAMQ